MTDERQRGDGGRSEEDGIDQAERLLSRSQEAPDGVTEAEMRAVVAHATSDEVGVRVIGAEALQHLSDRPALFEPHVSTLIAAGRRYPETVDGVPSPESMMASEAVRATIYIGDSLARVAQARPSVFEPHVDQLVDVAFADESAPAYFAFVLGYVSSHSQTEVPEEALVERLCSYLGRGRGLGHPSFAADALRALGDARAIPALEANYPEDSTEEATRDAFDAALAELDSE